MIGRRSAPCISNPRTGPHDDDDGDHPTHRRKARAALISQEAAQAASRIKASSFFRTLAGPGPIPGCRGATPHRGAGVLLLCRTEGGGFHLVSNAAWRRYLPPGDGGLLVGEACASRCPAPILLAG